jgi:cytochrome c oxidase accessory protein FixG
MCVQVCPTGIDIRDGLQLECVNCTQCIDACNSVMDKVGLARGLIGYSSENARDGEKVRRIRPRVVIYPAFIGLIAVLFVYLLLNRQKFDMTVLRNPGRAFNVLADGKIENTLRIKLVNRTQSPRTYNASVLGHEDIAVSVAQVIEGVEPLGTNTQIVRFAIPPERFTSGHLDVRLRVESGAGESQERYVRLLGPIFIKPKVTTP